jgi:hypothetical protein
MDIPEDESIASGSGSITAINAGEDMKHTQLELKLF